MATEGEGDDPSTLLNRILSGDVSPTKYRQLRSRKATQYVEESEESNDDNDVEEMEVEPSGGLSTEDGLRRFVMGQLSFRDLKKSMDKSGLQQDDEQADDEEEQDSEESSSEESEAIEEEPQPSTSKASPKKRKKYKERRSKLDVVAGNQIGSAEIAFARGDHEDAIRQCLEVVKDFPRAFEPYQTLGDFYEELGNSEKSYQYQMIAAYLNANDSEVWQALAEKANDLGKTRDAISFYGKAMRLCPDDYRLRLIRGQLYEELGDVKRALQSYEQALELLPENEESTAIGLATILARVHFNNKNCRGGITVMEKAFARYESAIVSENVNTYLELLIAEKEYVKAVTAFKKYCDVKVRMAGRNCDVDELEEIFTSSGQSELDQIEVSLPKSAPFPIDLQAKLTVSLINLKAFKSTDAFAGAILNESPQQMGDLFLDVAEAYMEVHLYSKAEPFLRKVLQESQDYNLSAVWLRFARCLREIGEREQSIEAFYKVVDMVPTHFDARLELSDLLLSMNRSEEATKVSFQPEGEELDLGLLHMQCKLLYEQEQFVDFVRAGRTLLSSDMLYLSHPKELNAMISSSSYRTRMESLKDVHKELRDAGIEVDSLKRRPNYIGDQKKPNERAMFDVFVKLCHVLCFRLREYKLLECIALSAYTCSMFSRMSEQLDFIAMMSLYASENKEYSYKMIKAVINRMPNNMQVWNLFCPIMTRFYQDLRHNRMCLRLCVRFEDLLPLAYFNGHNALMSGSYKHALAEYVNIHKQHPGDPFAALCVSIGFLHLACQKFVSNKNSIACQLTAFLDQYIRLRGECQESLYNCGRAFHQLGLVHNAVHFYRRALDCPVSIKNEPLFDLRREIGYNLSLVYRASGSAELALDCLHKYCSI